MMRVKECSQRDKITGMKCQREGNHPGQCATLNDQGISFSFDQFAPSDRINLEKLRAALHAIYPADKIEIYQDYDAEVPEAATYILIDKSWSVTKLVDGKLQLDATVYDHGDSVTPPSLDVAPVETYDDIFLLAERIAIEEAQMAVQNSASNWAEHRHDLMDWIIEDLNLKTWTTDYDAMTNAELRECVEQRKRKTV